MARACGSMAKAGPSGRKSVITRRAARGALVAAAAAKKLSSAAVDEGKFSAEDAAIVMDAGGTKSVDSAAAMAVSSVSASGATSAMWAAALEQVKAEVGGEDAAEVAVMKPRVGSVVDAAMMERALSMVKPLSKRATGSDWAAAAERCLAETEVKVLASDDSKFELIEDAAKVALAAQAGQKGAFPTVSYTRSCMSNASFLFMCLCVFAPIHCLAGRDERLPELLADARPNAAHLPLPLLAL